MSLLPVSLVKDSPCICSTRVECPPIPTEPKCFFANEDKQMKNGKSIGKPRVKPNWSPVFQDHEPKADNEKLTKCMIKHARKTGILSMADKGLMRVPEKVYELDGPDDEKEVTLESLCMNDDEAWWNQVPMTNLDLSSNCLQCISPRIRQLSGLTTLTLHDNVITSIPKSIYHLENLQRVNLCRNKLQCLPVEFFRLRELRYLNLSYNEFKILSADVSDLHMLEILDVSHNQLTELPCGIGFLSRLTELYASNNNINTLPPDMVSMRSLQHLDLMYNNLRWLPKGMCALTKLKCLYIKHNCISDFPDLGGCVCLQELHAGDNKLSEIPKHLCPKLVHLELLDLSCNKLTDLPDDIYQLQNLKRLDLSNNCLKDLPHCLARLPHLVSLQVEGNQIKSIRSDILKRGTSRILKTLRERCPMGDGLNSPRGLELSCCLDEAGNVFPDKYKMRKTRSLSVPMENLDDVPDKVFETASEEEVAIVDFSRNRFTALPKGLERLRESLSELVFAKNQISEVPIFISQFTRLSLLNLSCNYLQTLPNEFGCLKTLREVNMSNNRFEQIPKCIFDLDSLEILIMGDNRIKGIDATSEGLGKLKRLATLDLRNNNIEQVPPILGNLRNINTLEINGNPFRLPRHQILAKGTDAIMSYLRDRIPT